MPQPRKLDFIASYPRSGNTWVRAFLFRLMQEMGILDPKVPIRHLALWLPWDIAANYTERTMGKSVARATELDMARARPKVHRFLAQNARLSPVVVKTHAFFGTQEGIPTIDPASFGAAVYLVRNPLDVLPSLAKHLGKTLDEASDLMTRQDAMMPAEPQVRSAEPWYDWSSNVRSWTDPGPPRLLVVKYEDLRANPKHVLGRIARRLGLTPSEAQLKRATDATALDRLEQAEATGEFKSPSSKSDQFFGGGAERPYHEKISPADARRLIVAHGPIMRRFGYVDAPTLSFAQLANDEVPA